MTGLSGKKKKALAALMAEKTIAEAARSAQISERTLYRWLANTTFAAEVAIAQDTVFAESLRKLAFFQSSAIEKLAHLIENSKSEHLQLQAAREILKYSLVYRENWSFAIRLKKIEEKIREIR